MAEAIVGAKMVGPTDPKEIAKDLDDPLKVPY